MREFISALVPFTMLASTATENPLWERLLEKWGIAFVMFLLFWSFTNRQQKKDELAQKKRDEADAADKKERLDLLGEIKELNASQLSIQEAHIASQATHAARLEQLTKDTTRAITDAEAAHRMLTRKFKRPCILQDEDEPNT